ncbi:MAG: hypothetical protein K1X75_12550 [Leptospirales bacterium]|nr:hypothetical protein [Leptospirales bacterium]
MEFEIRDPEYSKIPNLLALNAPAFKKSEEYTMHRTDAFKLPSVAMGAFADYVCRLAKGGDGHKEELEVALEALELLTLRADSDINSCLKEDFLESIREKRVVDLLIEKLGPATRMLLEIEDSR